MDSFVDDPEESRKDMRISRTVNERKPDDRVGDPSALGLELLFDDEFGSAVEIRRIWRFVFIEDPVKRV